MCMPSKSKEHEPGYHSWDIARVQAVGLCVHQFVGANFYQVANEFTLQCLVNMHSPSLALRVLDCLQFIRRRTTKKPHKHLSAEFQLPFLARVCNVWQTDSKIIQKLTPFKHHTARDFPAAAGDAVLCQGRQWLHPSLGSTSSPQLSVKVLWFKQELLTEFSPTSSKIHSLSNSPFLSYRKFIVVFFCCCFFSSSVTEKMN